METPQRTKSSLATWSAHWAKLAAAAAAAAKAVKPKSSR